MREAKTRTSWTDPDPEYESQVLTFAELVLEDEELTGQIGRFAAGLAGDARANALGAKLVQLTMPGVADTYQGCELAGLRLVNPDNRAPADFARRRDLLAALDAGDQPRRPGRRVSWTRTKLLVTALALRLRREHPDWFAGEYAPLAAEGPAAAARGRLRPRRPRGHRGHPAARRAARSAAAGPAPVLPLPHAGPWRDLLTGAAHAGARPLLSDLLQRLPVALLVPARRAPSERVPGLGPGRRAGRGAAGSGGHGRRGAAAHAPGRHPGLVGGGRAGGGRLRDRLRVPGGRRRAAAGPAVALAAAGQRGAEPHLRSRRLPVDRPGLAGRAAARRGDLRDARGHVHPGGDVRRGDRAARPSPRPGRGHDRADAGGRVPRPARLGLRRHRPVGRARAVRRPGRAEAVRGRLPRPPRGRPARRGLQPRRHRQPPGRLRPVLHRGARDPLGPGGRTWTSPAPTRSAAS